jgi:hypothetical protein
MILHLVQSSRVKSKLTRIIMVVILTVTAIDRYCSGAGTYFSVLCWSLLQPIATNVFLCRNDFVCIGNDFTALQDERITRKTYVLTTNLSAIYKQWRVAKHTWTPRWTPATSPPHRPWKSQLFLHDHVLKETAGTSTYCRYNNVIITAAVLFIWRTSTDYLLKYFSLVLYVLQITKVNKPLVDSNYCSYSHKAAWVILSFGW